MTAAVATTIASPNMILSREDHEPLLIKIIVPRLDFQGLLFSFHEFIPEAVCYLNGSLAAIQYFQATNLLII